MLEDAPHEGDPRRHRAVRRLLLTLAAVVVIPVLLIAVVVGVLATRHIREHSRVAAETERVWVAGLERLEGVTVIPGSASHRVVPYEFGTSDCGVEARATIETDMTLDQLIAALDTIGFVNPMRPELVRPGTYVVGVLSGADSNLLDHRC